LSYVTEQVILELWSFNLPYGSTQCYLPLDTSEHTSSDRAVLDLPTLEEWKAELTWVTGYIPKWFIYPQMVSHPSTDPAV